MAIFHTDLTIDLIAVYEISLVDESETFIAMISISCEKNIGNLAAKVQKQSWSQSLPFSQIGFFAPDKSTSFHVAQQLSDI